MLLRIPVEKLKAFLDANEDCEALSAEEYVADLYGAEPPLTVNVKLGKDGAEVEAAAYLQYDAGQDGWYMGERVEDEEKIRAEFLRAMGD